MTNVQALCTDLQDKKMEVIKDMSEGSLKVPEGPSKGLKGPQQALF